MAGIDNDGLLRRVGERVRALRTARGWTLKELAERCGLSLRFVGQLEAGRANIAIGRLGGVARAFGVPLASLVEAAPDPADPVARAVALLEACAPEARARALEALELALDRPRRRFVALLGMRGAGKSTLGPVVAEALGIGFVELDDRIEAAAGLSLTEVFSLHGEAYYRRLEAHCLADLIAAGEPCVVALPGGVVHDEATYELVKRHATTLWLRAAPEDHMQRVLAQGDRRPVAGATDAMAELRALLAAREPLYAQADLTVDTSRHGERSLDVALAGLGRAGWPRVGAARG